MWKSGEKLQPFQCVSARLNSVLLNISGDFIMSKFEELKDLVTGLEGDFSQFYGKNNKAAGTRVRKAMQDVKKMAQDIRVEVQEMKNK